MTLSSPQDDDGQAPATGPENAKNYITPHGYRRLCDERQRLVNIERPEVVQIVSWAASNGDRSENGDYIYGKKRLREIDKRIRFLTKRIEAAEVVDPGSREATDQIFFGATVLYCDDEGEEHCIQIVGIDEVNAPLNRVSWISPIAQAMLKAREGDQVQLRTPQGIRNLDILSVKYVDIANQTLIAE